LGTVSLARAHQGGIFGHLSPALKGEEVKGAKEKKKGRLGRQEKAGHELIILLTVLPSSRARLRLRWSGEIGRLALCQLLKGISRKKLKKSKREKVTIGKVKSDTLRLEYQTLLNYGVDDKTTSTAGKDHTMEREKKTEWSLTADVPLGNIDLKQEKGPNIK